MLSMLVLTFEAQSSSGSDAGGITLPSNRLELYQLAVLAAVRKRARGAAEIEMMTRMMHRVANANQTHQRREFTGSDVNSSLMAPTPLDTLAEDGASDDLRELWRQLADSELGLPLIKTLSEGSEEQRQYQFKHLSFQEGPWAAALCEHYATWDGWADDVSAAAFLNDPFHLNTCKIGRRDLGEALAQRRPCWDFSNTELASRASLLTNVGIEALWPLLEDNHVLTTLILPSCGLEGSLDGSSLGAALLRLPCLEVLDVSDNPQLGHVQFGVEMAQFLRSAAGQRMRRLILRKVGCSDATAKPLLEAVGVHEALQELDIGENEMQAREACAALAKMMRTNTSLLNLNCAGIAQLSEERHAPSLVTLGDAMLDNAQCALQTIQSDALNLMFETTALILRQGTHSSVLHLLTGILKSNASLTKLSIGQDSIGAVAGARFLPSMAALSALARCVRENKGLRFVRVDQLSFGRGVRADAAATELGEALLANGRIAISGVMSLTHVANGDIFRPDSEDSWAIGPSASTLPAVMVAAVLQNARYLTELRVREAQLDEAALHVISNVLSSAIVSALRFVSCDQFELNASTTALTVEPPVEATKTNTIPENQASVGAQMLVEMEWKVNLKAIVKPFQLECISNVAWPLLLASALRSNHTLRTLSISRHRIGAIYWQPFATAIATNSTLTTLNLDDTAMNPSGCEALAVALSANTALVTLCCSLNPVGSAGGLAIARMLTQNTTLTYLDLHDDAFGVESSIAVASALVNHPSVTRCNLRGNVLSDEDVRHVLEMWAAEPPTVTPAEADYPGGQMILLVGDTCVDAFCEPNPAVSSQARESRLRLVGSISTGWVTIPAQHTLPPSLPVPTIARAELASGSPPIGQLQSLTAARILESVDDGQHQHLRVHSVPCVNRLHSVTLNRFNHAVALFPCVLEYEVARSDYLEDLAKSELHVEHTVTGVNVLVKDQQFYPLVVDDTVNGVNPSGWDVSDARDLITLLLTPSPARVSGLHPSQPVLVLGNSQGKTWMTKQVISGLANQLSGNAGTGIRLVPLVIYVQRIIYLLREIAKEQSSSNSTTSLLKVYIDMNFPGKKLEAWRKMLMQAYEMRALVVLLDGVDDAPPTHCHMIEQLVHDELVPSGNRILATSRPKGLHLDKYSKTFVVMKFQSLNNAQQLQGVHAQVEGNVCFEHLLSLRRARQRLDDAYRKVDAQTRSDLELMWSPNQWLCDGAKDFDPKERQREISGERIVAPTEAVNSKFLRELDLLMRAPLDESRSESLLDRIDKVMRTLPTSEVDEAFTNAVLEGFSDPNGRLEAQHVVAVTLGVMLQKEKQQEQLLAEERKKAGMSSKDCNLAGVGGGSKAGDSVAAARATKMWELVMRRTDEIYIVAEHMQPIFEATVTRLVYDAGKDTEESLRDAMLQDIKFSPLMDPARLHQRGREVPVLHDQTLPLMSSLLTARA